MGMGLMKTSYVKNMFSFKDNRLGPNFHGLKTTNLFSASPRTWVSTSLEFINEI